MTRTEKLERIIDALGGAWPHARRNDAILALLRRHGLSILTPDALEELASDLVTDWRLEQKINRRNREIYRAREINT